MSEDKTERDDMRRAMLRVQAFERELLNIDDPNERIAALSLWRDAQVAIIERDGHRWLKLAKAKAFRAAVAYHENARAEALDALANLETGPRREAHPRRERQGLEAPGLDASGHRWRAAKAGVGAVTLEELIKAIDDDCDCHGWADDLKALPTPAAGPWIPVGERPPKMGVPVLISDAQDGMRVSCAYSYRAGEVHWEDDRECGGLFHVTHWAELRGPK